MQDKYGTEIKEGDYVLYIAGTSGGGYYMNECKVVQLMPKTIKVFPGKWGNETQNVNPTNLIVIAREDKSVSDIHTIIVNMVDKK